MNGTVSHSPVVGFFTCTVVLATGLTVSRVIVLVVVSDSNVSDAFVTGLVNALLCLTVTGPVGSTPLSANSAAVNVTFPLLSAVLGGSCLLLIVKVTVAPGNASVTVIP